MDQLTEKREALVKALEVRGWYWEDRTLYAPNRTMWLSETDSWLRDMEDSYQRMKERKERIIKNKQYHSDPRQHQDCVNDVEGVITALGELLEAKQEKS